MQLQATKVFHECWEILNRKVIDDNGKESRYCRILEQVGGSRSSKTWSNFLIIFSYALQNKNKRIYVMRDTATDCRENVEDDWRDWLKDPNQRVAQADKGFINYDDLDDYLLNENLYQFFIENKTKHSWHLKSSGSTIVFTGVDDPDKAIGKAPHVLWINEPYVFSEEVFKQLAMRTKDFIMLDWNPKQKHWITKLRERPGTITHKSTLLDNPFCPEESRIEILSKQPLSYSKLIQDGFENERLISSIEDRYVLSEYLKEKDYKSKDKKELIRCYNNERQLTANEFDWLVYGLGMMAENPNKIYKNFQRISVKKYEEIKEVRQLRPYYGVDFGFASPSACLEVLFDGDRSFYIRQKLYKPLKETDKTLGDLLLDAGVPTGEVTYVICDQQDNLVGVSDNMVNDLRVRHGINAYKGAKPKYVDRFHFINNVVVFYTDDSKDFEDEYNAYEYDDTNGNLKDKPKKKSDHLMNAMEYILWFLKIRYDIKI